MKQIFMEEVLNQVRTRGDCEALVDQEMGMMTFSEMCSMTFSSRYFTMKNRKE